jgi:sigma-B regulation protein RsbU (phosphoserine phosphatase)
MKKLFNATLDCTKSTCIEIENILQDWGAPEVAISDIVVSIDEALTNIILHGYTANQIKNGEISIELFRKNSSINIIIEDKAPPYSLNEVTDPDIKQYFCRNIIGGFGVFLIKNLMDSVKITRLGNTNILWMSKTIPENINHNSEVFVFSTDMSDVFVNRGIFKIRIKPGSVIDMAEAQTQVKKYKNFISENYELSPEALLVNIKDIKAITRDASDYYSVENPFRIKYMGIVVDSSISWRIGNLMLLFNRSPGAIIKLFTSEQDAMVWLQSNTQSSSVYIPDQKEKLDRKIFDYAK